MLTIIAFTGALHSGKSTAAGILHDHHGFSSPLAFATPMKAALCSMLGIRMTELERLKRSNEEVFPGATMRRLLQTLGTEWGRQVIHPDIWLLCMQRAIEACPQDRIVIEDCRFDNEAAFVRALGGHVVHINWHDRLTSERLIESQHSSEAGVTPNPADYTISNYGDVAMLQGSLDKLLDTMGLK